MKKTLSRTLLMGIWLFAYSANAAPLYFESTGSYYDVVSGRLTWSNALTAAASMSYLGRPGRLATITSQAENDFVVDNLLSPGQIHYSYWLGGYQPAGSPEPAGGWRWITDEPFSFTNWDPTNPSNSGPTPPEDCLELYTAAANGKWNDLAWDAVSYSEGYIVEYAIPEPGVISLLGLACIMLFLRPKH